ncbi:MAG: carboxylesterase family protein [Planctomycetaceae bacterium]|nr:carboxylesterase family protein [Planctomycetaceae bacterium]
MSRSLVLLLAAAVISASFSPLDAQETKSPPKAKSQTKAATAAPAGPPPTMANVAYGSDPRQVVDFYKADSKEPTPVLFFIHGGGWQGGDKARVGGVASYLAAGISVVSIEYRFVSQAHAAGIKPPVQWPLHDAARALQFVRSKAGEWNLDKKRIAASGGSAGAASSLWLAFHDDLADPQSSDPVARESTRLIAAGVLGAQTSLDPQQMREWMPNITYGGHAFGFVSDPADRRSAFQKFYDAREQILPWIKEYSPYELVSKDDPAIYLQYNAEPAVGKETKDPTHSASFGLKLQEKLKSVGVECDLMYPGATGLKHATAQEFLIAKLKAK